VIYTGNQSASITQTPSSCTYSLNPNLIYVGAVGGVVQTTITAGSGCPWAVVNNQPTAVSVTQGATGTGSGTVALQLAPTVLQIRRSLVFTIGNSQLVIEQTNSCAITNGPTVADVADNQ
jgi:hypothetical protein